MESFTFKHQETWGQAKDILSIPMSASLEMSWAQGLVKVLAKPWKRKHIGSTWELLLALVNGEHRRATESLWAFIFDSTVDIDLSLLSENMSPLCRTCNERFCPQPVLFSRLRKHTQRNMTNQDELELELELLCLTEWEQNMTAPNGPSVLAHTFSQGNAMQSINCAKCTWTSCA